MSATVFDRLTRELRPPLTAAEAVVEADRCLECGVRHAQAPCTVACPAGVDVPGFVTAIADGDAGQAAAIIFRENILGATCARVCPVEVLCEAACVLEHDGRKPIAIASLQRYATDTALAAGAALRDERAADRPQRRRDRRRPGRARLRRRACGSRPRRDRLRRARRDRRARPVRDRAVPHPERAAAREARALEALGVELPPRHTDRRRLAARDRRQRRRRLPRRRDGRRQRRRPIPATTSPASGTPCRSSRP